MINQYVAQVLGITSLDLEGTEQEKSDLEKQIERLIEAFATERDVSPTRVTTRRALREEFVNKYAASLGMLTADLDEKLREISRDTPPTLMDLLNTYAQGKGVPLECFYDPNGITDENFALCDGAEKGASQTGMYHGTYYGNLKETVQKSSQSSLTENDEVIDKVYLAIPPSIGSQIYGQRMQDYFFVGTVSDPNALVTERPSEQQLEEDYAARQRGEASVTRQGSEKKIKMGAHDFNSSGVEGKFGEHLSGLVGEFLTKEWRRRIEDKLKRIFGNKGIIEDALRRNYAAADAAGADAISVSDLENFSVEILPASPECDFAVKITVDVVTAAPTVTRNQNAVPTPSPAQGVSDDLEQSLEVT